VIEDEDEILAQLDQIEEIGGYQHYRPLEDAANEFIRWAETPHLRVYTGIPSLDAAMRGTAPGEMTIIQGYTHSGKTLVATEILANNVANNIALFTPDETRPLVLTKLTSAVHGVDIRELERRIQEDDQAARDLLINTARQFNKLSVFDDSMTISKMDRMLAEVREATQEDVKAVMFDYVSLLEGADDVKSKMTALKAWGKRQKVALFALHQSSRTSGAAGKKQSIDSGEYGGEAQATHVIAVRRKKYAHIAMLALLEEKIANASNPNSIEQYQDKMRDIRERLIPEDENTITISLVKNKRPPCVLVDDEDYLIDQDTGKLRRCSTTVGYDGGVVRTTKAQLRSVTPKPWEERNLPL
jgi:replicative DNA helicase